MIAVANIILLIVAIVLVVPVAILLVEGLAALLPGRSLTADRGLRPSVAVLVPAHDEEADIAATIGDVLPQLGERDRLVVVADNCTDCTAEVARAAGAIVVERRDPSRTGKGYALDHGLRFLATNPPCVVVMIDADCRATPGTIDSLARQAWKSGRPAQATNLLEQPPHAGSRECLSVLAFLVKNLVRPRGLQRLGLPCLLTGTGMAFPWRVVEGASPAGGSIVEDMQMGTQFAVRGYPPIYCPEARVTSRLPNSAAAAFTQRTRWEHGHLETLLTEVPRLLAIGVRRLSLATVALALEVAVPPLSLLAATLAGCTFMAALAGALGCSWVPAAVLATGAASLFGSVMLAWLRFGRGSAIGPLLSVPLYVIWKIPIYLNFLVRRQTRWIRTERDAAVRPQAVHHARADAEYAGAGKQGSAL